MRYGLDLRAEPTASSVRRRLPAERCRGSADAALANFGPLGVRRFCRLADGTCLSGGAIAEQGRLVGVGDVGQERGRGK